MRAPRTPGGDTPDLEGRLRAHADRLDHTATATLALESYGPEILGYLVAAARDEVEGREVFGEFSADLWHGLPKFRWECSMRTWAYAVARHSLYRHQRAARIRAAHHVALPDSPSVLQAIELVRSRTPLFRRTEARDAVARLRDRLEPDEQLLLVLRVDRQMEWRDVARILAGPDDPGQAAVAEEAAKLRKRYERIKKKLRHALAETTGDSER